jgi:asparagine synthase (glutamine-hydrolysing)
MRGMCGIAGFVGWHGIPDDAIRFDLDAMTARLVHRGPDDRGAWQDGAAGVGLGFRRLSIIDLSPTGHQPMTSSDGRYVIVFNGEVYNFLDLRDRLVADGARFRGTSDTEVILESAVRWGARETVHRLSGMFAFALWDRRERLLLLARDRFGKKPLYYGQVGDRLWFASELKAIRAVLPSLPIDRAAAAAYFRRGYVPSPRSIYRGISKLPPGCLAEGGEGGRLEVRPYWDARSVALHGQAARSDMGDAEAVEELDRRLRDAVRRRMVADVPLGAFLSGGIDSSAVVAVMQAESPRPVRTFALGFREADYDEAPAARAVASRLGTDHTELYVTADDALRVIPSLPEIYDEPFADYSQIPSVLVASLARAHVTVALSGDGGDEVFGGYVRYLWAGRVRAMARRWPALATRTAARLLAAVPPAVAARAYRLLERRLPADARQAHPEEKLAKFARVLSASSDDDAYERLVSLWSGQDGLIRGEESQAPFPGDDAAGVDGFVERMMLRDQRHYLPDDILVKVDRATMAASLESRAPLLDHELAEWLWTLPLRFRCRDGEGKWLLRQVLARHLPPAMFARPKTGFGIPVGAWLRGPLRDWCEDLLDARGLAADGLLNPAPVRRAWADHLSGRRDHYAKLWAVLMFRSWVRRWEH